MQARGKQAQRGKSRAALATWGVPVLRKLFILSSALSEPLGPQRMFVDRWEGDSCGHSLARSNGCGIARFQQAWLLCHSVGFADCCGTALPDADRVGFCSWLRNLWHCAILGAIRQRWAFTGADGDRGLPTWVGPIRRSLLGIPVISSPTEII